MNDRIKISISEADGWIRLNVRGDIHKSYPIYGDEASRRKHIAEFASDLEKAVSWERLSTLS